jgi:hypothetical protein
MRSHIIIGVTVAVAGLFWARSMNGQVQPVPGPGTGIVTVQGEVDVRRLPPVEVVQRGGWRVSLADVADVRVVNIPPVASAPLAFVRVGVRYDITWPAGDRETVSVAQLGSGGWIRATVNGRQRWVNLSVAKAIEEAP